MLLIPLISVNKNSSAKTACANAYTISKPFSENSFFSVLDESSGKILKIPEKEMIYAAVATEMPAAFEVEALKAQAVASYTYFCHLKETKPKNQEYDFKINPLKNLNFTTENQMKKNWGNNFDKYYEKIKNATDEVFKKQLTYDGKPIFAAYHAISSGMTEKSEDIFGGALPYLTNVESYEDKTAKGYETKTEFSESEFKKILYEKSNFILETPVENIITNYVRTNAGSVKELTIGPKTFKGTEIRNFFNLRSSNFKIDYIPESKKFIITTLGYGHGVGMSQFGANHMAKEGKNYEGILARYYPGAKLI